MKKQKNGAVVRLPKYTVAQKRNERWGWLFILPWFIGAVYFFLVPMVQSGVYAFSKVSMLGGATKFTFVGLDNFIYMFTVDAEFLPNLADSLLKMVYQVPVIVIFSLLIAMVLRGRYVGHTFFRAMFFFPVVIASGVVITILQTQVMMTGSATTAQQQAYMFSLPSFDGLTELFGLPSFAVDLADSVVNGFFDITWKSGVQIILLLAAVNHISPSSYEAADIEGATAWEKLWKITIPMISPTILVVVIYSIIDSFTDYNNQIMRMIDEYAGNINYEYSTTIGLVYFLVILVLVGLVNLVMGRFIHYSVD